MKKLLRILLTLAACSAALCVSAAAVRVDEPAPTKVWGKVSPWDGDGIFLKNDDKDDPLNEVVLQTGGDVFAVDGATGLPLDLDSVKEGDTLYAWIGPVATMSLPPHVFPEVIVGNVPEGTAVPEYYKLRSGGWIDPAGSDKAVFSTQSGSEEPYELEIPLETQVLPWLTKQIVKVQDIEAGSQVLVWRDSEDVVTKVLLFPYAYRGICALNTAGTVFFNGEDIGTPAKILPGEERGDETYLLPVRALAEAAGYEVRWDRDLGAVVSLDGETVFSAKPGADVLVRPEGETSLSSPCVLENGVTYLPEADLCTWLNLFFG